MGCVLNPDSSNFYVHEVSTNVRVQRGQPQRCWRLPLRLNQLVASLLHQASGKNTHVDGRIMMSANLSST